LSAKGSAGAIDRSDRQPDPGPMSGVLPIDDPADEPEQPEARALPLGPRSVVPAGRKSLTRRDKKRKASAAPRRVLMSPLANTGPWADPKEPPPPSPEVSEPKRMVRPYTRTGGRTHVGYRLELETLLTTPQGRDRDIATLRDDYRTICEMCRMPQSTAEIAARLGLPLGAARVLIGDVVDGALLYVSETTGEGPTLDLLSRVAKGLRRL
jgi:Protein of unknown function (DUF742)